MVQQGLSAPNKGLNYCTGKRGSKNQYWTVILAIRFRRKKEEMLEVSCFVQLQQNPTVTVLIV